MKEITYTITDPLGIHARPAGMLVKKAAEFHSSVKIRKDDKEADGKRILNLMGLAAKKGDRITLLIEGPDEAETAEVLERFLKENL